MNAQDSLPLVYRQFKYLYEKQGSLDETQLRSIYAANIEFVDPVHRMTGLQSLIDYFADLSKNLMECRFEFVDELVNDDVAHITWNMEFSHKRLSKGKQISLRGMSLIRFDEKIYYHEDCYDLGAMIYDNLPVLGNATRFLKNRLKG